ncbi:MAG TPA: GC-type dockerin domain-anchored protein [Candidatus Methylomirabilis sp.]|nr:GC-type dockerin domain-anchored protein [Candidatus Methylomirabilis sp.]
MTATIPATDLTKASTTIQITVTNPTPGGGTSNAQTFTINNPVPTTTSISPTSKTVGDAQFTLTINGTNFVSTSVVDWNGSARATTFVNDTQLTATIPATDLTKASTTIQITVTNPTPGGGTSNAQTFTINNPVPTTTSISPTSKTVGDAQFTLTINGTNFVSTSVVDWNGSARATTFVNSTQLTAVIPATDLTAASTTIQITVVNPTPGGGTSNAQTFTINNPVPTTTSISPTSKTVGDAQFTLTINGTNFVSTSVVDWNGSARATTFVNSTQLTAVIPATDLTKASTTIQITVTNPTPGGGTSNAQTFTINNLVPTTTSISPTSKTVGDAQFTLTINGTNFVSTSVVDWNGSARATTFVNSTQLTAVIPATDLTKASTTIQITVTNPTPGGGTSNAQTFTINNPVPTTTSISPTSKTVGDAQFTLTVNGTNFVSTSVVDWNGSARATTFVSSTSLTAIIPTTDLATSTTASVTVFNPAPGGGTSNAQNFIVNNLPATKFIIVSPASGTVDAPITVTVEAVNDSNDVIPNYQQDVTLVVHGSASGGGLVNIVNGVGTTTVTDHVAETAALSLSDTENTHLDVSSTANAVFAAGVPKQLILNDPGDMTAGAKLGYTVTRKDQYGNITAYGNTTVYLYSNSTGAHKDFFDAASGGNIITSVTISNGNTSADFWYYDELAGTWTITASDNSSAPDGDTGLIDSADQVTVSAGAISQFSLNNPGNLTAGNRLGYMVSRLDQFGNAVTTGSSTVYLYSNSGGSNKKFYDAASGGNIITSVMIGAGNSSASFWYYDDKAGGWVVTASDNATAPDGVSGINDALSSLTVTPAATYQFFLNNPGDMSASTSINYMVTRKDQFDNLVTSGADTIYLYTNSNGVSTAFYDSSALINKITSVNITDGNSTANFWYFDNGVGAWTITASDNSSAPDGSSGIIDGTDEVNVSSAPIVATRFIIIDPTDGAAGDHIIVTIKAEDDHGNTAALYNQSVTLVASGAATGGGLVNLVDGVGTTTITDTVAQTVNLSLSDTENTGLNVSSVQDVVFSPGAVHKFVLTHSAGIVAGTRASYTVTRQDDFGNAVVSGANQVYLYTDSISGLGKFYDAAVAGSVITSLEIAPGSASADFWYTDQKADNFIITVSDNSSSPDGATGIVDATDNLTITPDVVYQFILTNPGDMAVSTRIGYQVSREDRFANTVTAGNNTVYLYVTAHGTSTAFYNAASGGSSITSLTISAGNSTGNFWYFDETVGSWTISASDNATAPDGVTGIIDATDAITVLSGQIVPTKFVLSGDGNAKVGETASVVIRAEDALGNLAVTYNDAVALITSGSAQGGGLIQIVNGLGSANISDQVGQTVHLSLSDTQSTGLDVSSTLNIVFIAPKSNRSSKPTAGPSSGGGAHLPPPAPKTLVLKISGLAYPGAKILLLQLSAAGANLLQQSTLAASDGTFTINNSGFPSSVGSYGIVIKDQAGRGTLTTVYSVKSATSPVIVNDYFAAPTLGLARAVVTRGDFIKVIGFASPNNQVTIQLDNGATYTAQADRGGNYQLLINTAALPYGTHNVKATQINSADGRKSNFSPIVNFVISESTVPSADFNGDGAIDAKDASIFLSLWQKNDPRADLNNDGVWDISDLSIFLRAAKIK